MCVSHPRRLSIPIALLAALTLACNLTGGGDTPIPPTPTPDAGAGNTLPVITVLWPPDGSEFVAGQEVVIRVSATDSVGVTRVELRSANAMLSSVPSPEQNGQQNFDALLSWTPTRSGPQALEVIAYRHRIASQAVPLNLTIRQRASQIVATPIPYGAAVAPAAPQPGAVCQVRVDVNELRFRAGPGTDYTILGLLDLGETLSVTGRNATGTWWQVNRGGQTAWVSSDSRYSTPLSDCAAAPVVAAPPH